MLDLLIFLYQYADAFALLMLSAVGLVIIFGMMGIINMAHGELMMVGAFSAAHAYHAGLWAPAAIVVGGIGSLMVGLILERLVIRFLYGRLLYSLVATWGLSLILTQGALLVLGPSAPGIPTNLGAFSVGDISFSIYRLALFGLAIAIVVALWALLRFTKFGLHARATMGNAQMAQALGVDSTRIYMMTFGLGSFLAGLAGALFALTAPVQPTFGASYTPIAFIVVVVAGARNIIVGLTLSVIMLAFVKTAFTMEFNILAGYVAMLLAALLIIRLAPNGISGLPRSVRLALKSKAVRA
ncbi:MAG TPA: branched-chain amino acid ABC transporter permease [Tianweitania sediminis]|jgi:branched-chain amino acid transport system permease protein|nr:branched-chain amino acid ABC transporter permease [Tianweitania sediminis]